MRSELLSLVPAYIRRFEPYIPSPPDDVLCRRFRVEKLHRLNNNENPLGPPSAAIAALKAYDPSNASTYPSGDCYHLRRSLAERHGLSPEQFLVGNGANEVITFVIKAFCEAGDNIVTADRTFAVYEWVAEFSGFEARLAPLDGYDFDPEAMVALRDERTKIFFVCNPNNPTGTYWNEERFRRFMADVGPNVIVVLDEAYAEYVEASDFPDGIAMTQEFPNLVVFRTFSKMYGLAGLRVGYLVGSIELVDLMRRTCVVYSVNALAQVGAVAALGDREHVEATRRVVESSRTYLTGELDKMGLPYQAGVANYVMVKLPLSDTIAYRKLMTHGYMVRSMTAFRYPNHVRISLAALPIMEGLVEALSQVLELSRDGLERSVAI